MSAISLRMIRFRTVSIRKSRCYSTTVDSEEIKHHNQFALNWWDKTTGPMKALHAMNNLRIPFIRTGLINVNKLAEQDCNKSNYLQGLKILDVGCGGGILSIPLSRLGADVTGIDASPELIEVAKDYASKNLKSSSIQFVSGTIEDHAVANREKYDVVVLSEVLEHVSMKEMFLLSCVDALKPGGSLFITTINRTNAAWFAAILMAEYVLNIVPKGNHEWSKLVTLEELRNHITNVGCKVLQINGMTYIPYRNVWCWVPNKSINYAVHAIKQC